MTGEGNPLPLRLYAKALQAYPTEFRRAYAEQALLTARDSLEQAFREGNVPRFYLVLAGDLLSTIVYEHVAQIGRTTMKRPIVFHTAALICVLTAFGFFSAIVCQQMLRRGADQPQRQMVETYAASILNGTVLETAIPDQHIDLAQSLETFLAFYDDQGRPLRSSGYLGSAPPVPPAGVFEALRRDGSKNVTWQPRPGVRLATVARRIDGPRPGFLVAGRSLRVTEEYENTLRGMAFAGWLAIVILLVGNAVLLNRATSRSAAAV